MPFDPTKRWTRVSSLAALHDGADRSDLYGLPIDAKSVGRFNRDLSGEEAAAVAEVCAEIIDEFGYAGCNAFTERATA